MNIQGQAALVTGGGSGLGEATARELARLGAKVAVLDLNLDNAQRAEAMQQEVLDRIYPAVTHTVAAPQESGPGFLERWGGHIFLVLLALALAAVVVKTLILEED